MSKSENNFWPLCDEINISTLALLITDTDPSLLNSSPPDKRLLGYHHMKTQLWEAFQRKEIEGRLFYTCKFYENGEPIDDTFEPSPDDTQLKRISVINYLNQKGYNLKELGTSKGPDFANKENAFYSSKLAAAVAAWKIVTSDENLKKGKSAKQALTKWLEDHADEYGLSRTGIDEAAKVANWETSGGAPSTPSQKT